MTVLLAGCGDLGTEAGLRFAAAGHRVIGWRRSPAKLPDAIEGVAVDLRNADLPTIPPDVSAVVVAVAADSFSENAYREAYVNGLTNVLSALERDSVVPDRILFVSSTAVYGDAGGGWVDEETTTAPGGFSGSIVRQAEVLLQERLAGTPTAAVTLRLGGIYGPGRTRLIETVRSGTASIPEIPRFTNRIHRDDAAAAIVHLLTQADTPSSLYVGVDNDPAQMADVLRFLAAELGEAEPTVGGAGDGRGGNKRCSNARLRHSGFEFTFPTFREGYRDILAGNGVRHP